MNDPPLDDAVALRAYLELVLDETIEQLEKVRETSSGRALIIESKRLRSVIGSWPAEVAGGTRREMSARVSQIAMRAARMVGVPPWCSMAPQYPTPVPGPLVTPMPTPTPTPMPMVMSGILPPDVGAMTPARQSALRLVAPEPAAPQNVVRLAQINTVSSSTQLAEIPPTFEPLAIDPTVVVRTWGEVGNDVDPRLVLLCDPESAEAVGYRSIRHRLSLEGDPQVVLVTAATRGEGASTCAANLALALGETAAAPVLLVEANFRTPTLARAFDLAVPTCTVRQLTRHRTRPNEPWVAIELATPWLHMLLVDPQNAGSAVLDPGVLSQAIKRWRTAGYAHIVLDVAAALEGHDANLIAASTDGVVLSTRAGRSRGRALRKTVAYLAPSRVLGFVFIEG